MDDKQIRENILAALDFEPGVDAAHIGVAVEAGVATLTGHVSSYPEKLAAERAVRQVRGVRAIAQDIEVRCPGDKRLADDEIAARALKILEWYAVIPQTTVTVTVQKGWVALGGEVDWQYQRRAAEDAVRKLSGVVGVNNNIKIKPTVATHVKERIEDALQRYAQVEAQRIRVDIRDGNKVVLQGRVDSWEERDAVENAAWSVAGVQSVDDRLTIVR